MLDRRLLAVLVVLVVTAAILDVRRHRIPNWLSLAGAVAGLALHGFLDGLAGLGSAAGGLLLLFALTFPFFALGWLGAGDVKLVAAIGALTGLGYALHFLLFIVTAGLLVGMAALARRRRLGAALRRLGTTIGASLAFRRGMYAEPPVQDQVVVPYAIAIALGTLAAALVAPWWRL